MLEILTLDFSNLEELMKMNRERFIEEQKRLREENKENIQLIKLDSIRNQ
ncbi:MAG: hypothetical protein R2816_03470 [Flavobacteriaceae bacterium]